uniref:Dynein light chain n=1 Tax=Setaria digitata TaxID=48799 RepID=A0A915Q1F5_9BILA
MESGEEINLLPYDYDLGGGGKIKEPEPEGDDSTINAEKLAGNDDTGNDENLAGDNTTGNDENVVGDDSTTDDAGKLAEENVPEGRLPSDAENQGNDEVVADESHENREGLEDDTGKGTEDQKPESVEPEEPLEPEGPKAPSVSTGESDWNEPGIQQPSFPQPAPVDPHESQLPSGEAVPELPESQHPHPPPQPQPQPAIDPVQHGECQIIATGMNLEMQQYASSLASQALAQFPNHMMAIARHIMMNFEQRYGSPWSCIVSNGQLGFYMRYDRQNHIYFVSSGHTIFLYKNITT